MLLAYVDESYDRGFYFTTAVILRQGAVAPLTGTLDDLAQRAEAQFPDQLDGPLEFHGYDLYHAENDWAGLKREVRARILLYRQVLDSLAAVEPHILIRGLDVGRQRQRYAYPWDPHEVALQHLLERVSAHGRREGEPILVLADELAVTDQGKHRDNLNRWHREGTPGYQPSRLEEIVDTIYFAPSSASRCLQAADMVSYLHFRIRSGVDSDRRAVQANRMLWSTIDSLVAHRGCWTP